MSIQKLLFQYNRETVRTPMHYKQEIIDLENEWIQSRLNDVNVSDYPFNWEQFQTDFNELIDYEKNLDSSSADYVANEMSIDEFRIKEF